MSAVVFAILSTLGALFRSKHSLRVENAALRHQLAIYQRTVRRPIFDPETAFYGRGCFGVGKLAGSAGIRSAGDRHRVATQTLSRSLEAHEQGWTQRRVRELI